jgi:outer membrane protein assembly factor BamB
MPDAGDGAPAYLRAVKTSKGTKDLVFVTGKGGYTLALDAHTGASIWKTRFPGSHCIINRNKIPCYETSSPAIDPNRRFVYSYGLDGKVHKLAVGTGKETKGGGWPETATRKPFEEKGSSALSIATDASGQSYLYVTNSGYPIEGELGDYQGHLTTINLKTGKQHVFNAYCSNKVDTHFVERPGSPDCPQTQGAIWARVGAVYDPATNRTYVTTSNGLFDPKLHAWGDTVIALHPDGTGSGGLPIDSYTPDTYGSLDTTDSDLGSTAPTILPAPTGSSVQNLGLQGGKDAMLRLIDLGNLSGQSAPGNTGGELQTMPVPGGKPIFSAPAAWVNPADGSTWAFVTTSNRMVALRVAIAADGTPSLQTMWTTKSGGASPLIANNVLYYASNHLLQALDPATGTVLWHSTAVGAIHWQSPMVANGTLYLLDTGRHLRAFRLPS